MGQQRQRAPAILLRSNRANLQINKKSNLRSFFSSALRFRHRLDLNAADFDALMVGKDQAPKSWLDRRATMRPHAAFHRGRIWVVFCFSAPHDVPVAHTDSVDHRSVV